MKKHYVILILLIGLTLESSGQIKESDSLKVMASIGNIFEKFENSNFEEFKKISAAEIYCIICKGLMESKKGSFIIERKEFYDKYLKDIRNFEYWKRGRKSKEILLIEENNSRRGISAYLTTWKENEYAEGHEGAQLGIFFQLENGIYKFAGIETIP